MGIFIALSAVLYAAFLVIRTFVQGIDVAGYASLMVALLFFSGVQLISVGILGEYIGRIFAETKNRPLYIVRETHGVDDFSES
jgi:glycosyltransferase involved in cell wall biosynthesis